MVTLHQLHCFVATLEHSSFTRAAESLGLAQPSLSEQIRLLEAGMSTSLFRRVSRGVVPTEAALALEPHARRALQAVEHGSQAVASTDRGVTGTIGFGLFGAAHLYMAGTLADDVRRRFPHARITLIGQHSIHAIERVRLGQLEAALVVLPVDDSALHVEPVTRDELVYVSADPDRVRRPVTATQLGSATLVLSESTWGDEDFTRQRLRQAVQSVGGSFRAAIEVEHVETAMEVAALGLADAITASCNVRRLAPTLPGPVHTVSLRPRIYDHFAIIRRHNAVLSRPVQEVVEMAKARIRQVVEG